MRTAGSTFFAADTASPLSRMVLSCKSSRRVTGHRWLVTKKGAWADSLGAVGRAGMPLGFSNGLSPTGALDGAR